MAQVPAQSRSLNPPVLRTKRLVLRPFTLADAPIVQQLVSDRDVASTTAVVPHPYPDDGAEEWIRTHPGRHARGEAAIFAITTEKEGVVGAIALTMEPQHRRAELGYWIGRPYWSRGYATEAARAVLRHGFVTLGLHRIHARHMARNPASGRVLHKLGMRLEGRDREHLYRFGRFEDLENHGLLRREFEGG
jgi:RimJ/RimL family protein N-acetyltransferase